MNLNELVEKLMQEVAVHDEEAAAFMLEVDRGREIFDSACAAKFHEGAAEAIRENLETLTEVAFEPSRVTPSQSQSLQSI